MFTENIRQEICQTYLNTRLSKRDIAKKHKCSLDTVKRVLKKANLTSRYKCEICAASLYKQSLRFCSKNCYYKSKRKYSECLSCETALEGRSQIKYCDTCSVNLTKQSHKQIYDKRKQKLIEIKGNCCEHCGYKKCYAALHFHHKNKKDKKFSLSGSGLTGHSWPAVLKELEKCQLLCANCHAEIEEEIRQQV